MRLRATIEYVPTFLHTIQAISRLSRTCMIKFSETKMRIICDRPVDGGIQVWSEIKVETLFTEYRIQSKSNNEITLRIAPDPLMRALKSAVSSPEVVLRLAKKNEHAVLSFDIAYQTRQNRKAPLTQDVRIEVVQPDEAAKLKEPMCPIPDIHIFLPPLSKLRTVTDHFRQLSDVLGISANAKGHLKIFIETETVKVVTEWKDCDYPIIDDDESRNASEPEAYISTLVSVKNFLRFLSSHVVSTRTIACICHKNCLIMHVYMGDLGEPGGVLTYYIPGQLDGIDD